MTVDTHTLPAPYIMDVWLEGYAACLRQLGYIYPERDAMAHLYTEAVQWIREHADNPGLYQLRASEVNWSRCSDSDERHDVLRDLLIAALALRHALVKF